MQYSDAAYKTGAKATPVKDESIEDIIKAHDDSITNVSYFESFPEIDDLEEHANFQPELEIELVHGGEVKPRDLRPAFDDVDTMRGMR